MSRLRWPLRVYIVAILGAAVAALVAAADLRSDLHPADTVVLATVIAMATVAQLWPVHISIKTKLTVDDTATFAAALLLGPFYAMVTAGISTLVAQHFRGLRQSWYSRAFNAATSLLATGAAASVFLEIAGPGTPVAQAPVAILGAAVTKYVVHSALVDGIVALQVRRNTLTAWWPLHRRLLPFEGSLLVLGAIAAIATQTQPWTLLLFAVPMGVVLFTLRDSARAREQTRAAVLEMADQVDLHDPYMRERSRRIAGLAESLARRLKLEHSRVELVRDAARVLDIGKMGTDDAMLRKAGPLTDVEQRHVRRHADTGYRLLRRLPGFQEHAELVWSHHERHDGTGYPRGLAGEQLPLEVSIVAIADAYDAMTSDRSYRKGLGWELVRAELLRQRGKQWREIAVDSLIELIDEERRALRTDTEAVPRATLPAERALT